MYKTQSVTTKHVYTGNLCPLTLHSPNICLFKGVNRRVDNAIFSKTQITQCWTNITKIEQHEPHYKPGVSRDVPLG